MMRMLTQREQLLLAMDGHEKACEALTDESKGLVSEKLRERLVDSMVEVFVVLAAVRKEMSLYADPVQMSFEDWLSPEDTELDEETQRSIDSDDSPDEGRH